MERFIIAPFGHLEMQCNCRPRLHTAPSAYDYANQSYKTFYWSGNRRRPFYAWDIEARVHNERVNLGMSNRGGTYVVINDDIARRPLLAFANSGWYTHNHRSYWAYLLLINNPQLLRILSNRFPQIVIDEFQDTTGMQQAILELLREAGSLITFIGDPDQCIYEFNQARPQFLIDLIEAGGLSDYPLTENMRSRTPIVESIRLWSSFPEMEARFESESEQHGAFICSYDPQTVHELPSRFEQLLAQVNLSRARSAVVTRGRKLEQKLFGGNSALKLTAATKDLAFAAHYRDFQGSYKRGFDHVNKAIRKLAPDDVDWIEVDGNPTGEYSRSVRRAMWRLLRNQDRLPRSSIRSDTWLADLQHAVSACFREMQVSVPDNINRKLTLRGLSDAEKAEPLSTQIEGHVESVRVCTIHQVKGETLESIMLVAEHRFITSALNNRENRNHEDTRIAYVAMSRPTSLLVIALPERTYRDWIDRWIELGFSALTLPALAHEP